MLYATVDKYILIYGIHMTLKQLRKGILHEIQASYLEKIAFKNSMNSKLKSKDTSCGKPY